MPAKSEWTYDYDDLARAAGLTIDTVHQHVSRGALRPSDLRSVAVWLAHHGPRPLKTRFITALTERGQLNADEIPPPTTNRRTKKRKV